MAKEWIILRCASQSTLPLERSLTRAGVEVWTPVEQVTRRVPRANVKRRIALPLLPSYLFANAAQMPEVLAILNAPTRDHREFRLFKYGGGVPLIADETLEGLRFYARKASVKTMTESLSAGGNVKLRDGGFAGLSGTIEEVGKAFSSVRLDGFAIPIKISNVYLLPDTSESAIRDAA